MLLLISTTTILAMSCTAAGVWIIFKAASRKDETPGSFTEVAEIQGSPLRVRNFLVRLLSLRPDNESYQTFDQIKDGEYHATSEDKKGAVHHWFSLNKRDVDDDNA